ncbi:MAG: DUF4339 domain-containing protein [Leptolyngbya sp. PLA1]|nr:DUF4339 domain-containing protein [Leptolyngbya sp. PLA1]
MSQWFATPDGHSRVGPLTDEQVAEMISKRQLGPSSLVWKEGMASWTPVQQVPELGAALAAAAAPAPPPLTAPPALSAVSPPPAVGGTGPAAQAPPAAGSAFSQPYAPMPATSGDMAPAPTKGKSVVGWVIGGVAVALCCLIAVPLAILMPALGKAKQSAGQLKDSTQVRGVAQGMVLWAQNNRDEYPLPSQIDKSHATIPKGHGKDLPRHIYSVLVYNGFISPELLVSPAETNPNIAAEANYQYSRPPGAVHRDNAMWDPSFKALQKEENSYGESPTAPGGTSYALMPPVGKRRAKWSNTFNSTDAILGNRGPAYVLDSGGQWSLLRTPGGTGPGNSEIGTGSYTLGIHGKPSTWEGNIGYNDMHVNFETRPDPESVPFTFTGLPAGSRTQFDNLFVDENDATRQKDGTNGVRGGPTSNANNLLRNWSSGEFDPETGALISIPSGLWFD